MTPDEAAAVLAYAAAADPRFTTRDADEAKARSQVWADLLAPVPPQFALDHARRYYARHHDWPLQPGAIRDAWVNYQRAEEAKARHRELVAREPADDPGSRGREAREAARVAVRAAAAAGPPERAPSSPVRPVRDEVYDR